MNSDALPPNSNCNFLRLFDDANDTDLLFEQGHLLAHYTSVSNLESILRQQQIWFSNPLYLNDYEELRFGLNEGREIFLYDENFQGRIKSAVRNDENYERLRFYFNDLFDQFERNHALDTFVLSFCLHERSDYDGKLSMWRGYGASGNGACLVFDSGKLSAVDESPLVFGRVNYSSTADRIEQLKKFVVVLCEEFENTNEIDSVLYQGAYYYFERLKIFGLFSKHIGFKEEDEFRLIYLPERDDKSKLSDHIGYHVSPIGLQPKLKLPIMPIEGVTPTDLDFATLIDRIILGPSTSSILAQNMFQRMLKKLNLESLSKKLCASTIPFRQL